MCKVAFFCQSKPVGSLPFSLPSPSSLPKLHSIQGMQNADIIHGDYGTWDAGCGIRGAGWGLRDWTNSWVGMTVLKNSKGNPRKRFNIKKKCWKNIFPHRNNNSQNNPTASRDGDSNGHENHCSYWAKRGECDKNPDWMLVNCKKSCSSKIKDIHSNCPAWAKLKKKKKNSQRNVAKLHVELHAHQVLRQNEMRL